MIDLRPCPFCGNNVRLEDREFDDFAGSFFINTMFVIECEKCGISMKRYPKRGYGATDEQKQDLINSWNRRTELMLKEKPEIVRCKNCKHCEYQNAEREWCKKGHLHGNAETWFCADGERRTDDA